MAEIDLEYINDRAKNSPEDFILESEKAYHEFVDGVARRICDDKKLRILLLAGPSGSGKTTTANLISDRIKHYGEECIVVSLDDFYRSFDDPEYPRLSDGSRDLEAVEALDLPLLCESLVAIAEGREFLLPRYDFKISKRSDLCTHPAMPDGCVIIEGLHALSPLIFSSIPTENALKLFISVSSNVNYCGKRIISGKKVRFIRRMVRDSLYRNATAERTYEMWKNVLLGEEKYLYPNRKYADINYDTFHPYELSVTSGFAKKLISDEFASAEPYIDTVLSAARLVEPISISLVPDNSLIREFVPGGKYEHLY